MPHRRGGGTGRDKLRVQALRGRELGLRFGGLPELAEEEPEVEVRCGVVGIDGDHLAYLRADFQVMRDGRALSKGVDQFTLVREPSGWKIAVVAYTSLPVSP